MAVNYEVQPGQTLLLAGPANVTIKGTAEHPLIVDDLSELEAAAPGITEMDPQTAEIGGADFTLVISGTKFDANSVIVFNIHDEPTTLNEDGTISTGVKPSLWGAAATVPVSVRNGPAHSSSVDFTFTEPGAAATSHRRR